MLGHSSVGFFVSSNSSFSFRLLSAPPCFFLSFFLLPKPLRVCHRQARKRTFSSAPKVGAVSTSAMAGEDKDASLTLAAVSNRGASHAMPASVHARTRQQKAEANAGRLQQRRLACGNAASGRSGRGEARSDVRWHLAGWGGERDYIRGFATLLGRSLELVRQLGRAAFRGLRR